MIVTNLTNDGSDSDNETDKKSSPTHSRTVTPNKERKHNVQTTIEKAIMCGYSSGRWHSHDAIPRNNWDSHNNFCESQFIYHNESSFAAPTYDTTTISPTISIRNSYATKLPMVSYANNDENLIDNSDTYSSNGKDCAKVCNKESDSHIKSNSPCGTNSQF